ncbi:sulfite exporter TauE/SafE family protein [Companilactobacillus zhachilii]|uniref:Probable membrane transporter protein n=1 Tax=Companilactobacillus zhachilii TaxID=2304606 RepID=A0A386PQ46_9LACO|nr:sulfite exporter TauE/SafE family protein [Companilactobacillus zhachilii]AYE37248.1 sulfite exporter TauE/SafE family protein [Companilactobacillus zhachilii]
MLKIIIYALIIFIANTIGAVSGMGGGLIIKPALQLIDLDNVILINFYSSFAVFIMSISSTWKQLRSNNKISIGTAVYLSLGSVVGGILGDQSFKLMHSFIGSDKSVVVQMILVIISLIISLLLLCGRIKPLYLQGSILMLIVGLFLGWLATLLGIGGGPINIAVFIFLFGIGMRQATIYSIITIFFSQGAKLIQALITRNVFGIDPLLLVAISFAAVFGGLIGAKISNSIDERCIVTVYNAVVFLVLILDSINLVEYLIL